ncbi:MAG TPA: hypothetical protein VFS43_18635 [Polyangiaceae bacterium]|nr:hypothetical protein [Polyangiaceae bacterium]
MPKNVLTYKCLIISPSDVTPERNAVESAIEEWNKTSGRTMDVRIECVRWEKDAQPGLSEAPQDAINRQLVDDSDMGIAIFWSRLGTPTKTHPSGSVEEIERLLAKKSNIMPYMCERNVPKAKIDPEQIAAVRRVEADFQKRGLLGTFKNPNDLAAKIRHDLTGFMMSLKARTHPLAPVAPVSTAEVAPVPNIRVQIYHMELIGGGEREPALFIKVENHSPGNFYFSGISIEMSDSMSLAFTRDISGQVVVYPPLIESANSFELRISGRDLVEALGDREPLHAVATDKISRTYKSEPGKLQELVDGIRRDLALATIEKASDPTKRPSRRR